MDRGACTQIYITNSQRFSRADPKVYSKEELAGGCSDNSKSSLNSARALARGGIDGLLVRGVESGRSYVS
jgi:hypothetical protein